LNYVRLCSKDLILLVNVRILPSLAKLVENEHYSFAKRGGIYLGVVEKVNLE